MLLYRCIKCDSGYMPISVIDKSVPISCFQFGLDIFACSDGLIFRRSFIGDTARYRLQRNRFENRTENNR